MQEKITSECTSSQESFLKLQQVTHIKNNNIDSGDTINDLGKINYNNNITITKDNITTVYSPNSSASKSQEFQHPIKSSVKTSTPITISSDKKYFNTKNGHLNDHLAYKEYKEAGEYWKYELENLHFIEIISIILIYTIFIWLKYLRLRGHMERNEKLCDRGREINFIHLAVKRHQINVKLFV